MTVSNRFPEGPQRRRRRSFAFRLFATIAISMPTAACFLSSPPANADFPEVLNRSGRVCGCGWGDGYHACHSSGVRPLADLPPRSYASRVGTINERIAGCPNCYSHGAENVSPIISRGPQTFYDRFDEYAAQITHREIHASPTRPMQPMIDPEYATPRYPSPREMGLQSNMPAGRLPISMPSNHGGSRENVQTADGNPAAPPLSVEELAEFRKYQSEQHERKKFEKYLVEPEEIEPSQIFGGPPVGTEERRRRDEARLSNPDDTDLPPPMDELLPPFPGDEELLDDQPRRDYRIRQPADARQSTPPSRSTSKSGVSEPPPSDVGTSLELLEAHESTHSRPVQPYQPILTQPVQNSPERITQPSRAFAPVSEPQARVASTPDWRFVKQPR